MKRAFVATVLLLAGCGSKTPEQPAAPIDSVQLNAIASSGPTVAEVLAEGNDATPKATDAKPVAFDHFGDWAVNPMMCARQRRRFADRTVSIGGESQCTIGKTEVRTDSEVKLTVTCLPTGGGIRTEERWSLVRRAGGDMIVARTAGNSIPKSVTLAKCG